MMVTWFFLNTPIQTSAHRWGNTKFWIPLPGGSRQCVYMSLYQKSTSWDGTAPKAYECPIAKRKGLSFSPSIFQVTFVRFRGSICPFHQHSLTQRKQSCCTCDLGHNHRHILRQTHKDHGAVGMKIITSALCWSWKRNTNTSAQKWV